MQGIKFYDPEIVGDTPETVEYVGIRNLLEAVKGHVGLEQGQVRQREAPCSNSGELCCRVPNAGFGCQQYVF